MFPLVPDPLLMASAAAAGQEKQIVPGAQHTACTIEMVSTTQQVDVAVIDEIQMIGDPYRGWAWTRALQVTSVSSRCNGLRPEASSQQA